MLPLKRVDKNPGIFGVTWITSLPSSDGWIKNQLSRVENFAWLFFWAEKNITRLFSGACFLLANKTDSTHLPPNPLGKRLGFVCSNPTFQAMALPLPRPPKFFVQADITASWRPRKRGMVDVDFVPGWTSLKD